MPGHPHAERSDEPQLHDGRHQHGDGLTEGRSLGLDAANTPAENTQTVCRGRVGVGAHERVEAGDVAPGKRIGRDDAAEALDVELVADATAGWNDLHVLE